jgi:hypothetical protein
MACAAGCRAKLEVAEAWDARAAELLERQSGDALNARLLPSCCCLWCLLLTFGMGGVEKPHLGCSLGQLLL